MYTISTIYNLWSCQNVCDALVYLLDNILIRFGIKLNRQTIGIPMGTNCVPLVANLFFFFIMREISRSLSHVKIRLTLFRLSIQLLDILMIY